MIARLKSIARAVRIALARKLGRRVVVLDGPDVPGTERAASAAEAVAAALRSS